jgi:hypothetical protein
VALYEFDEAPGSVVHDRSGIAPPLDLAIENPKAVRWSDGVLRVTSGTKIVSAGPAAKIVAAVRASGEFSVEAWVTPVDAFQTGPARIVSISADPSKRHFTLGQNGPLYDVRFRTSATDANGIPSMPSADGAIAPAKTHVVYARDAGGTARLFINGRENATRPVAGDLSGWTDEFRLLLANELTGDRPWLGALHRVALYDRALAPDEVAARHAAGSGDGEAWPAGPDPPDPRLAKARTHWAFQPLRAVEPPPVNDAAWVRTPIDRFILAALEARDLRPAPPLDAARTARRLWFDVAGLPPPPEAIDAFLTDAERDRTGAEAALVDRLLADRAYGERWGRHWLDAARYADSNGMEGDKDRPHAYAYRDFVIRALNEDLPYDLFVRRQIAGDEIEPDNPSAVAATGFLTAGPSEFLEPKHLEEERLRLRYNELDDVLSTTGSAFLGLTLGCARCHDHKYDAVTSREYYRMLSAFHSGERKDVKVGPQDMLSFRDFDGVPRTSWLFRRGNFYDREKPLPLGFLEMLSRGRDAEAYLAAARRETSRADTTFQRRALADWITDVEHGAGALAARVIVNRVWHHHFGEGLVRTVGDFGVRGDPPSHPDLLEWLAHDFVAGGWKLKRLHRMILTSAAYGQAERPPQRLEAEVLRDAMLAAAGTLNPEPYGPGFKPPIPPEAMAARNNDPYKPDAADAPATLRRSVYMFHKRVVPYPLLQAFDRPDAQQACARRDQTTVAPQALALLNDAFVRARAFEFADRLLKDAADEAALVERAFRIALARSPTDTERTASLEFLRSRERERRVATADFCQTLFCLNEFIYVD